jgi:hypothetical protein
MSSPYSSFFRRRTIGRAASPPTWAWYEQISYEDEDEDDCSDSGSEGGSCSEDEEDYVQTSHENGSDHEHVVNTSAKPDDSYDIDMEIDEEGDEAGVTKKSVDFQKDVKGKQRAIEPESESPKKRHLKKRRESVYALRPILTIQKSQGFVWNQVCLLSILDNAILRSVKDLFVPPYIKDRCPCCLFLLPFVSNLAMPPARSRLMNRCRFNLATEPQGIHLDFCIIY